MMMMMKHVLAFSVILAGVAVAEDEMMEMALASRERILILMKARGIPGEMAQVVVKLADNDVPTRERAVAALLENPDRKKVIHALVGAMREDDNNKRPNAGTILVKMGAEAVPSLIDALNSTDVRSRACWALTELGDAAKPAVPVLVTMLQSSDANTANDAAVALGVMGTGLSEVLPALIETLKHENQEVRAAAATAIKQIGPKSEHIALLLPALKDPYMKVRSTVVLTFGYMGDAGKPAIPNMIGMLKDENAWVRFHSAAALGRFGAAAKDAVPGLRAALADETGVVRGVAATSLARIHPVPEIVPDLIKLVQDENERVRTLAEDALFAIGKPALEDLKGAAEVSDNKKLKAALEEIIKKIQTK